MSLWSDGIDRSLTGRKREETKRDHWLTPYVDEVRDFIKDYLDHQYPDEFNTCEYRFHDYDAGSLSGRPNPVTDTIWSICGDEVVMRHTVIYQQNPYRGLMGQLVDSIERIPNPSGKLSGLTHKMELNIKACTDYINANYCDENKKVLFLI